MIDPAKMAPECDSQPNNYVFQSQMDSENDPDSPGFFSMTQCARELGIDVTWASSPNRPKREKRKQQQPPHQKDTEITPKTSTVVRRNSSIKNRPKQLFKQGSAQQPPKTGIFKFMEEIRSLLPSSRSSSWPPEMSTITSTPRAATASDISEYGTAELDSNMTDIFFDAGNVGETVSWNGDRICMNTNKPHSDIKINDELSSSLQNEFLNDSDFDMELIKTSQEAEDQFQQQQQNKTLNIQKNQNSLQYFFEQDSFDDMFVSKELDQLIAQSQQVDGQPRKSNISLERHKSMPTGRTARL